MIDADAYMCRKCGFLFAGYGRSPPYPYCPECDVAFINQLREPEVPIAEAGFIPARIASY